MSITFKNALAIVLLIAAAVWIFWPAETEPPHPGPQQNRTPVANTVPDSSPYLTSHDQQGEPTPTGENVDRHFQVEVDQLREAVRSDSNDVDAMLKLARLAQNSHQLDEAITLNLRVIMVEPDNYDARLDLSRCYGLQEDWPRALRTVDVLLTRFPDDPGGQYNRGAILANMGDFEQAKQMWTKVAQQDEDERLKTMAASALDRLSMR
jgi:tetratricopeptide (TPR) repeat protein